MNSFFSFQSEFINLKDIFFVQENYIGLAIIFLHKKIICNVKILNRSQANGGVGNKQIFASWVLIPEPRIF